MGQTALVCCVCVCDFITVNNTPIYDECSTQCVKVVALARKRWFAKSILTIPHKQYASSKSASFYYGSRIIRVYILIHSKGKLS